MKKNREVLPDWLEKVEKKLLWISPTLSLSISVSLGIKGGTNYNTTPPFVISRWKNKLSKKDAGKVEINTKEFLVLNYKHPNNITDAYRYNRSVYLSPLDINYFIKMLDVYHDYLCDPKIFVENKNRRGVGSTWILNQNVEKYDREYKYIAGKGKLTFMLALMTDYEIDDTERSETIPGLIIDFEDGRESTLPKNKLWGFKEYLKRFDLAATGATLVQTALLSQAVEEGKTVTIEPELADSFVAANISGMDEKEFLAWCRSENLTINLDDFDTLELAKSSAIEVYKDRESSLKKEKS